MGCFGRDQWETAAKTLRDLKGTILLRLKCKISVLAAQYNSAESGTGRGAAALPGLCGKGGREVAQGSIVSPCQGLSPPEQVMVCTPR